MDILGSNVRVCIRVSPYSMFTLKDNYFLLFCILLKVLYSKYLTPPSYSRILPSNECDLSIPEKRLHSEFWLNRFQQTIFVRTDN